MKKIYLNLCVIASLLISWKATAQMSGAYNVPGSFSNLAAAISSVNTVGINGTVVFNIAAGYTETAPLGGFELTATGTSANQIIFQKSGSGQNPLLSAYSGGTATPSSAVQDGIFRLVGSDYVTIANIDLEDLNLSNPSTMEYGFGLYKASATDGCQHITIVNCVISLNTINNGVGTLPAYHGSRGINVVNATPLAQTTSLSITAASGANSNNGFYANTIQQCNYGISIIGFTDVSPFANSDAGNNVSGNTIQNFGGASAAANPAGGVITFAQQGLGISGNTFNNNTGSGTNHSNILHGIEINAGENSLTTVNGNTLTILGGGSTQQVTVIETSGPASGSASSIDMNGNYITGCDYPTATSGNFYGIFNSAKTASLGASGNSFFNNATSSSSGSYYNIYNSGAVTKNISFSGNSVNTLNFNASSVSSTICNIFCAGSGTTANAGINGNTFQNINFSGSTGGTGIYSGIYFTTNADTLNVSGNSFNNLSLNSTGSAYLIYNNSSSTLVSVLGNNISNGFTRTSSSGNTYFYYGSSTATSGSVSVSYNSIANVLQNGTSGFYGIYNNGTQLQSQEFSGNTFNSITSGSGLTSIVSMSLGATTKCFNNVIDNVVADGALYGIRCNSGIATNNLYQNTVNSFTGTGASTVFPVYIADGAQADIYKNKIYDITTINSAGSVYGIFIAQNTATLSLQSDTIYNNLIGDLHAPTVIGTLPVAGIYIAGGTQVHAFYNTVYLATASSGSLFGSSALFASTISDIELKNNILINNSISSGTAVTSAYSRNNSNSSTYLQTSNNNLFYAGPISNGNSIYYDGTSTYPYLSSYKTLMSGKDLASVTENPTFISTQGSNSNFLDLDPNVPTQAESGAAPISSITDDYFSAGRNVSTPDIGAWENAYTSAGDMSVPTLLNSNFTTDNCSTTARTLTVNLVDASGVASGLLAPKIYYKINSGSYSNVQGSLSSGTFTNGIWIFNLSYAAAPSDVISYYLVAQDVNASANLGAYPPNGFSGTNVNAITTAPTVLNTYSILSSPVLSASSFSVCSGSTASLTANAFGASAYAWAGPAGYNATTQFAVILSATNASAGIYTLIANAINGCTAVVTETLVVNSLPSVSISSGSFVVCAGQSTTLSALGAQSYSWMPGNNATQTISATLVITTVYSVTGTNSLGCSGTATANVSVNPSPVITIPASTVTICSGEFAPLSASGATSYSWFPGTNINPTITVNPATSTIYTVSGTNTLGCSGSAFVNVVVNICAGVDNVVANKTQVTIFPNPSSGLISVSLSFEGQKEIFISNALGETIHHIYTTNSSEDFNLSSMAKGVYFVKVLSSSHQSTSKFITQ